MSETHRRAILRSARQNALDMYLAALLAPRRFQADLITLAAFKGEIATIPHKVNELLIGEMRLQWWRDCFCSGPDAPATGNPTADAIKAVIKKHNLDPAQCIAMIDAQVPHIYGETPTGIPEFHTNLARFDGTGFALAAQLCKPCPTGDATTIEAATSAGRAYGTARILNSLRRFATRGIWPLPLAPEAPPLDHPADIITDKANINHRRASVAHAIALARPELKRATPPICALPDDVRPAFLPLALVEPYFKVFERTSGDPLLMEIELAPMARRFRLWCASPGAIRRRILE